MKAPSEYERELFRNKHEECRGYVSRSTQESSSVGYVNIFFIQGASSRVDVWLELHKLDGILYRII